MGIEITLGLITLSGISNRAVVSSRRLIDQYLSGKSARYIVGSLVEELPSHEQIRTTLYHVFPKGTKIVVRDDIVYLRSNESISNELIAIAEMIYPELEVVLDE